MEISKKKNTLENIKIWFIMSSSLNSKQNKTYFENSKPTTSYLNFQLPKNLIRSMSFQTQSQITARNYWTI